MKNHALYLLASAAVLFLPRVHLIKIPCLIPEKIFFGTYNMSCNCNVTGPNGSSTTTVDFSLQIVEIPGDSVQVELLNLHNQGQSILAEIVTANSFNTGSGQEGTIINNTLTLNYVAYVNQELFQCNGSGSKQ